ncbi:MULTISPECIES: response regulator [Brevundimonas]|uniref:response regulator n=1 Tax=Brevundimonas TaxID=41275 RepID=UPI000F0185D7|nr:response regulator [Brevundimonas lutea]
MNEFFYVLDEKARLLFVDDDPILREFARVNLASESCDVEVAADGVEALERIAEQPFDLLLVDLEMPRMDGFELLGRLREDPRTAHLPVVVETGREDVTAIDRAFRMGATSFVSKPLNWRLLTYQLRFVLRAARAESLVRRAAEAVRAERANLRQ